MATNFVQDGDVLDLLAPYDRTSGLGMQVGQIFAVALGTALSGAAIRGKTTGLWLLTKVGSQAWAVGDRIYWDNANKRCTTDATAGILIGVATAIAGSGSTVVTGYVRLNGIAPVAALVSPVTVQAADGAIAITPGAVVLTKGSAAAMTLAAPTAAQAGTRITISAGSAFAHVVTATGLLDDGVTGGSKNTWTSAAFVGSSVTLMAYNLKWVVISKNLGTTA